MDPLLDNASRTGPLWVWPALAVMLLLAACAGGGYEDSGRASRVTPGGGQVAVEHHGVPGELREQSRAGDS